MVYETVTNNIDVMFGWFQHNLVQRPALFFGYFRCCYDIRQLLLLNSAQTYYWLCDVLKTLTPKTWKNS